MFLNPKHFDNIANDIGLTVSLRDSVGSDYLGMMVYA